MEPSQEVKSAAARIQDHLAEFSWLTPVPEHFLHVWLGGPNTIGDRASSWAGAGPFEIECRRINCFHSAVVVEAHADRLHAMIEGTDIDPRTFLPHMTIAVTNEEHDPADLRRALVSLREDRLGATTASEAQRIRFPASRVTLLRPWEVLETVTF